MVFNNSVYGQLMLMRENQLSSDSVCVCGFNVLLRDIKHLSFGKNILCYFAWIKKKLNIFFAKISKVPMLKLSAFLRTNIRIEQKHQTMFVDIRLFNHQMYLSNKTMFRLCAWEKKPKINLFRLKKCIFNITKTIENVHVSSRSDKNMFWSCYG